MYLGEVTLKLSNSGFDLRMRKLVFVVLFFPRRGAVVVFALEDGADSTVTKTHCLPTLAHTVGLPSLKVDRS